MSNQKDKNIAEILADSAYLPESGVYKGAKAALEKLTAIAIGQIWAVVFARRQAPTYEVERRIDGSIQIRLHTAEGAVDLVFVDDKQMLSLVAGQHVEAAEEFLKEEVK